MNVAALRRIAPAAPAETEAQSLPAWIYRDAELRSFARRMRILIPESTRPQPPPRGWSHG